MSILNILKELEADNSRLAKEAILDREKKNYPLQRVIKAALDPFINYWILKIPEYEPKTPQYNLDDALTILQELSDRKVTGNSAIARLKQLLEGCAPDLAEVVKRIIAHDLRCGVGSICNKTWPGIIPTFEVMLAYKDCSGIKYPCIGQTKMDGGRIHMTLSTDGTAKVFTRNGKEVTTHGVFDAALKHILDPGQTIDGEFLCSANGKFMDRKAGNGIFNKAVKGTVSPAEAEMFRMVAWDLVDFTGKIPYIDRLTDLSIRLKNSHKMLTARGITYKEKIFYCNTRDIKDVAEAEEFYQEMIALGEEGIILKNTTSVWEGKRTKNLGKMKAELDCSLRVVGFQVGTGKYAGKLGALTCESEDGMIRVSVGSGFSDEQRKWVPSDVMDKILDVTYNARIKSKGDKVESLFLPRFTGIRMDKTEADMSGAIL